MKNSLKNGKKVLSMVLSVLMIMSCFVFAPIASAADTLKLTVKITVTNTLSVSNVNGSLKLRVTDKSNHSQESEDFFRSVAYPTSNNAADLQKGKTVQYDFTIKDQVSEIALITDVYTTWHNPSVDLGIKVEAWLSPSGASIISGSSVTKTFSQCWSTKGDNFKGGKTHVLADSSNFISNNYPTYLIRFLDLNGEVLKSEKVRFGENATAPALPTKAADDTYHYTVKWDKGNSAWTSVKEDADIRAKETSVEHTYGDWTTTTEATCTADGEKTRVCSDCGYVQTESVDATGHSYGDWTTTTAATCTTDGVKTKICTKCGNEITETITALGHDWKTVAAKAATCTEAGYDEYQECSRCGAKNGYNEIPATGHALGEWKVVNASTCIVAGTEKRECSKCDYFETRALPLAEHTPKEVAAKAATCTEAGLTAGSVCSVCGKVLTAQTTTPVLGHDMKEVGRIDSTCTAEGVIYYECSRCDFTDTKAIPKKDHTFSDEFTVTVKATCTTEGEKAKLCTVCKAKDPDSITVIPARSHSFGEWTVVDAASCTEKGLEKRVCQNAANDEYEACTAFETQETDALGHDLVHHDAKAATCTEIGWNAYDTCSRCDYTTYVEIEALGHDLVHHDAKAATCTEIGWNAYDTCSRCDYKANYVELPAIGHEYVGAITTRPTKDSKGLATYTCTRDASHVYTLAMDLADYEDFNKALDALKEIAKKDLTKANKDIVEAAIAEAETLPDNLIAGVMGQDYTNPLDQYKHDFGEQDLIDAATAKLEKVIKDINDQGDEALNKYKVTFKDYDGSVISTETVVSGKSATAPENRERACDADNHYTFTGWKGNYTNVAKDEVVVAEYKAEAHNFVENTARYVAPSKNDDGTWNDGTIVKECTGCSCEKSESIARADYETRYDPAYDKVQDILDNPELDPKVKKEIEKILEDNGIPIPDDYDKRDQKKVDDAADILEGIIGKYTDGNGDIKEEYLKHYTITFIWHGNKDVQSLVKGAKIVAPVVENYTDSKTNFTYRFLGWDKEVPSTVTGDATFTAKYSEPRSMDDVKEVIKDAEEVINNDDYYDEDQKKVEDAKKELEDYLDEKGVDLDKGTNPVEKGSKEDEKITELVEKLRDVIDNAKKNKENRDNNKHQTKGFMAWITRLLILVKHLLGMA